MRYYNYLNEDKNIDEYIKNHKLTDLYNFIGSYFWRGVKRRIETYEIITPRKNRRPLDTDETLHTLFDNEFNKQFGWKARSNGVFCTSNKDEANMYGTPYIFLPYSKYSFIYSTDIVDLYTQTNKNRYNKRIMTDYENTLFNISISNKQEENDLKETIAKLVKTYTNNDMSSALRSRHEVMFNVDKYLLINEKYYDTLLNKLDAFGFKK